MKYYITNIALACDEASLIDPASDILKTFLAEIGYEAFEDNSEVSMTESGNLLKEYHKEHPFAPFACFSAFIQQSLFDENVLKATLDSMPFDGLHIYYNNKEAEDRNWNEQWEQSLEQSDICQELGITIDVKQAFGTGGHNTTRMIVNILKTEDLCGKTVLDCGCGSGILSIAALKLGAERAVGYDIDEWSVNNSLHNAELNAIPSDCISVLLGDASVLDGVGEQFDFVLANINRNILLADMPQFVKRMKPKGKLILSGFYTEDIPLLIEKAESLGLSRLAKKEDEHWASLVFGTIE